jgi:hypothetical protein
MKKSRYPVGACLAVALLAGGVLAAEGLKSGPQVGDQLYFTRLELAPLQTFGS